MIILVISKNSFGYRTLRFFFQEIPLSIVITRRYCFTQNLLFLYLFICPCFSFSEKRSWWTCRRWNSLIFSRKADCSQISERRRGKMHVRGNSAVRDVAEGRQRRIRGSRERRACRGVNFNTPGSFFFSFPYRARVHRLFSSARTSRPEPCSILGSAAAAQWGNRAISKPRARKIKGNAQMRAYVYLCIAHARTALYT